MDPILEAKGLTKTHSAGEVPVPALRGVDLTLLPGDFVAVMGPSGCGKSTLLNLLGGLDKPTEGEILLRGHRVDRLSESAWAVLRRRKIGFVFQFFNLIGNLSVADNIELPALLAGMPSSECRKRRQELLTELGIADKSDAAPSQLSGGQQQRVALARALINVPDLLLADEPTGNLDSSSAEDVLEILKRHHELEQTILMVTHDARVAAFADRIVTMRDGRIVEVTTPVIVRAPQTWTEAVPAVVGG